MAISMHSKGHQHAIPGNQDALKGPSACNPWPSACNQWRALTRQWPLDAVSSAHTSYVQSSTASPSSTAADAHATLDGLPIQAGAAAAVVTALKPAECPLEPELIPSCTDAGRSGLPRGLISSDLL